MQRTGQRSARRRAMGTLRRTVSAAIAAGLLAAIPDAAHGAGVLAPDGPPPLGTRTVGPAPDSVAAGQPKAFQFEASNDQPIDVINVYLDAGTSATRVATGIYANAAGDRPGELLASGSIIDIRVGWNSIPVSSTAIEQGERYWIAIKGLSGRVVLRDQLDGNGDASELGAVGAGGTALPSPWQPSGGPGRDGPVAAFATESYRVLVFTANATVPPATAVTALRGLAYDDEVAFDVTSDRSRFTAANLGRYRAVVFLNTSGDVLRDAEQEAFEDYIKAGGGFLGVGSAIETETDWPFFTELVGTRAAGRTDPVAATVKVADRVHAASRQMPERWTRTDRWYNFTQNVRGYAHVLATVDETTYTGGTNGFDHPIIWCKEYQGGRSFYTAGGGTPEAFGEASFGRHLAGALDWSAGVADATYSDCGATVLANYQQRKLAAQPNIDEPIGFDVLPDGRVIQTSRHGQLRLHDPSDDTTTILANIPVYTHSEDGLYGPAIDNDFATNRWIYLFYAPPTVRVRKCDGTVGEITTPAGGAPAVAEDPCVFDEWKGYFQLSRFKFVEATTNRPARLDLSTEQKILQVPVDRGQCCHVAGDIDFDRHNNLWMVTGDDTGFAGGFGMYNDMRVSETQQVRTAGATGGTFTLEFEGETTAPIPYNATAVQVQAALEALAAISPADIAVTGTALPSGTVSVTFDGRFAEKDVEQLVGNGSDLVGTQTVAITTPANSRGGLWRTPTIDSRRSSLNTNDLRGKILRIKVRPDGSYTIPDGNLFPKYDSTGLTRPEIYAMGFRNPFRIQVDENDIAYVNDYSPDNAEPLQFRGPQGTGRVIIVREPSNYGWPVCVKTDLPYYPWNFNTQRPLNPANPQPFECDDPDTGPENTSRLNTGRIETPPMTDPEIWYSRNAAFGTPCFAAYGPSPTSPCPQLFPEIVGTGTAPHNLLKYDFDPDLPSTKFPAYYDEAVFFSEYTRNYLREIRLDSNNRVLKINDLLDCGPVPVTRPQFECDNPMDMQFGPDGAFYLLTYGDGDFRANPDAGMYKFEYVKGTRAPQAQLTATPSSGHAPLSVAFSSAGSRDPDPGEFITFAWDFENDGTVDSTDPNPTHVYTANGVYTARLTVTDSSGKTDSKTIAVTVGNTAPTMTVTTPVDGGFFEWGQSIPYTVTVTDPEDPAIDCDRVQVTFVLQHDDHGHGEAETRGCSGVLPTSADSAVHGGSLAGAISATYTDQGANGQPALTASDSAIVQIKRQQVEFAFEESGTSVPNSSENDPFGGQQRGSLDPGDWIGINRPINLLNMEQKISFRFAATGTAGQPRAEVDVRLDAPDGPVALTAVLKSTGSNSTWTTQTFDFPTPVVGSHRMYLAFRSTQGGPTASMGNLNWVEFTGPGIGITPAAAGLSAGPPGGRLAGTRAGTG
jgi:PKD repeat protein/type 1 glutamine amidotransferase